MVSAKEKSGYQYIQQFLKAALNGSEHTKDNYEGDLHRFFKYAFKKNLKNVTLEELNSIDYDTVIDYLDTFENVLNTTINRHLSSVKSLIRYLKGRKIINQDIDFINIIKSKNNDGTEIEYMPFEVILQFLEESKKERNHALIKYKLLRFVADQGLRLQETLSLKWNNFIVYDDGVLVQDYGKGNEKYTKKLSHEEYESLCEIKGNSEYVFSPLSRKNVGDMMIRIRKKLGYEDRNYSFHSFKKSAVTFAYRLTNDILEAKRIAGHSSLETTQIYVEPISYGIMGMFSLENHDREAYKKATHEELVAAIESMGKDFMHILNIKLK